MSDALRGVASAHNAVNAVVQMYAELLSEMERRLKIATAQLEEARKSAYAEGLNQATLRQTIFKLEEENASLRAEQDARNAEKQEAMEEGVVRLMKGNRNTDGGGFHQ